MPARRFGGIGAGTDPQGARPRHVEVAVETPRRTSPQGRPHRGARAAGGLGAQPWRVPRLEQVSCRSELSSPRSAAQRRPAAEGAQGRGPTLQTKSSDATRAIARRPETAGAVYDHRSHLQTDEPRVDAQKLMRVPSRGARLVNRRHRAADRRWPHRRFIDTRRRSGRRVIVPRSPYAPRRPIAAQQADASASACTCPHHRVSYQGQPVALLIAETLGQQGNHAATLVRVDLMLEVADATDISRASRSGDAGAATSRTRSGARGDPGRPRGGRCAWSMR